MQPSARDNVRQPVMDRIAKGFSESEIASISAWYAAQND